MNYGQVKNQVLQLLNQYTVAGTHVALSYNNQQDYVNRIPALVNDAVLEIATTTRKIQTVLTLQPGICIEAKRPDSLTLTWRAKPIAKDGDYVQANVHAYDANGNAVGVWTETFDTSSGEIEEHSRDVLSTWVSFEIELVDPDTYAPLCPAWRFTPGTEYMSNGAPVPFGDRVRFELPDDFYQFKTGDTFVVTDDGITLHTNRYQIEGKKYLLIPKSELDAGREYTITYYRYPHSLGDNPADDAELDNEPETHYAVPFYVAAFLVIHDDAFLFSAFYNKYEDKLAKMGPGVSAEIVEMSDGCCFNLGAVYET